MGTLRQLIIFLAPLALNLIGFSGITEDLLMKVTGVTFLGRPVPEGMPYPSPISYMGVFTLFVSYYGFWVVGRRRAE